MLNYRILNVGIIGLLLSVNCTSCHNAPETIKRGIVLDSLMIRTAEIEIDSTYFDEYLAILKEESAASVRLEKGVICIYPMYTRDRPTSIRLLEIYASREDYASHLQTEHFQKYKTSTAKMVTSLELVEMEPIDLTTMPEIFVKLNELKSR